MIFKGNQTEVIHHFTKDVDSGYRYFQKYRGRVQMYTMESKDFISNISFKLKKEPGKQLSSNGQNLFLRLFIREIEIVFKRQTQ